MCFFLCSFVIVLCNLAFAFVSRRHDFFSAMVVLNLYSVRANLLCRRCNRLSAGVLSVRVRPFLSCILLFCYANYIELSQFLRFHIVQSSIVDLLHFSNSNRTQWNNDWLPVISKTCLQLPCQVFAINLLGFVVAAVCGM